MPRFRKRPVAIEAWRWEGGEFQAKAPAWLLDYKNGPAKEQVRLHANGTLSIPTLEGEMRAQVGDWVIMGVVGEVYPCKPAIFEATYEAI